ncbi:hypothetical protein D0436_23710 [Shewanella decolorationis]|uniref:Uncharacterized protein n=1 Tax=Shewanella decolorationis TaxID=256839 RepID=A0A8A9LE79_9GAMM|nr:hypothetical protein [Shewanella decolorationis]QTS34897.1 hypothetical protein D0436_23710 [Shewanella decolorationis]
MDIIAEPPWMALRRVTEAMEFGVSATSIAVLDLRYFTKLSANLALACKQKQPQIFAAVCD